MKRILSWALVLSMLASTMPTNLAWAEELPEPEAVAEEAYVEEAPQEEPEVVFEEEQTEVPEPVDVVEEQKAAEPVGEPEEPATEETPEATEEPAVEETPEATEEPAVEETPEATEEPAVEETPEATEEPAVEETPEATEEPAVEETPEATEEPAVEETPEATVEPAAEPTLEPTEEPSAEETPDLSEEKIEEINVFIQWDDRDDEMGLRPEKVEVKLCGSNGSIYTATLTENTEREELNWAHSFMNLPKYHDGEEIEYIVETDDLNQYETDIDGYVVTFSCKAKPTAEPTEVVSPEETPEPEATEEPEMTEEPEATVEPEATEEPEATVEPTATPEATAEPTIEPTPEATEEPAIEVPAVTDLIWADYALLEDGTNIVTLSWSFDAPEGADYTFTVERAEEGGEFEVIAEGLTETSFADSTAVLYQLDAEEPEMKVYTYRVSAVCGEAVGEAAVLVCNEENVPSMVATLASMPRIRSISAGKYIQVKMHEG